MSYQYICATCGKKEQSCECHKNYPRPSREQDEIERLRDAIKRQAAAAKIGMDAATRISSVQLEQARIARAESSPDAIDSERNANAVLTGEVERLRAELAAAKRDAERYRWLRGDCPDHSIRWTQWEVRTWLAPQWTSDLRFTHLDVAIDAAMKGDR